MILRRLLQTTCVLILTAPRFAIAQTVAPDGVTGTWTGDIGRRVDDTARQPVTVELKLENDVLSGTVTGPPQRGSIRSGSYDASTGRLRFDVFIEDGSGPFVFDGMIVSGTALGTLTGSGFAGDFKITKGGPESVPAAGPPVFEILRFGFDEVNNWVIRSAAMVPPERWGYQPVPAVRTFGQLVAHVADSYLYYCGRARDRSVQWSDAIEKGDTDKATVMRALERAAATCGAAHSSGAAADQLMTNIAHTNLHYGNMVTYLRMLGLVPPSS